MKYTVRNVRGDWLRQVSHSFVSQVHLVSTDTKLIKRLSIYVYFDANEGFNNQWLLYAIIYCMVLSPLVVEL